MRAAVVFLVVGVIAFGTAQAATGVGSSGRSVSKTGTPRFHATLRADGHVVSAGASWHWVVRSFDLNNHPIPGTAIVRVRHAGRIVDTVGWFGFKAGVIRRTYRWSTELRGSYALLEAKIVGPGGTRTLAYSVRVR